MQPWVTRAHFYKSLKPEVFIKNMKSHFFFYHHQTEAF